MRDSFPMLTTRVCKIIFCLPYMGYCARCHWFWKIWEQFRAKSDIWYCWSSKVMSFRIKKCFIREGESGKNKIREGESGKNKKGNTDIYTLLLLLLSRFSRVRLCDPRDGSPPGSPVPGILQARTLEWVAISFNAWKWKVKVKSLSRVWLLATPWTAAYQAPPSMGFSRQEYWSGLPLPSPSTKVNS